MGLGDGRMDVPENRTFSWWMRLSHGFRSRTDDCKLVAPNQIEIAGNVIASPASVALNLIQI